MRLGWTNNKNSTTYRAVKTIRVNGKNKTLVFKTFGSDKYICETYGVSVAKAWALEQVRLMDAAEKEESPSFSIQLSSGTDLTMGGQRCYNGGYLFLQDIYIPLAWTGSAGPSRAGILLNMISMPSSHGSFIHAFSSLPLRKAV